MLNKEMFDQPHLHFTKDGEKRLRECLDFINTKRPDLEANFQSQFMREHWKDSVVHVMQDFAPLSFYFVKMAKVGGEWVRDYNGGIIFHGSHDRGGDGGAPTFSVNLTPVDGWATHT